MNLYLQQSIKVCFLRSVSPGFVSSSYNVLGKPKGTRNLNLAIGSIYFDEGNSKNAMISNRSNNNNLKKKLISSRPAIKKKMISFPYFMYIYLYNMQYIWIYIHNNNWNTIYSYVFVCNFSQHFEFNI